MNGEHKDRFFHKWHTTIDGIWTQDCMIREPTTFPLSYRAQWNCRVTLQVMQPKSLLPFGLLCFGYVELSFLIMWLRSCGNSSVNFNLLKLVDFRYRWLWEFQCTISFSANTGHDLHSTGMAAYVSTTTAEILCHKSWISCSFPPSPPSPKYQCCRVAFLRLSLNELTITATQHWYLGRGYFSLQGNPFVTNILSVIAVWRFPDVSLIWDGSAEFLSYLCPDNKILYCYQCIPSGLIVVHN